MLKIVVFLFIFMSVASAKDLNIISNGSNTGILSQLLQEYTKEFLDYRVSIKYTNSNCALSKMLWNESKDPTLFVFTTGLDASVDKNNQICYFKISESNLLFINYSAPMEFCSITDKNWENFIQKNSTHTVGITATSTKYPEIFMDLLSQHYGINLKLVRANTNLDFMTMARASELDFGFRTGLNGLEFFKNKCYWDVSQIDSKNLFSFLENHRLVYNNLFEDSLVIHKNLSNDQILDFRTRFHKAWKTDISKALRSRRGYDDSKVNYNSEEERIKVFNKFLEKF